MSLVLKNISKKFSEDVIAVNKINFELNQNKTLSILGKSGCGKTTLLRLIAGFETPDSGEILLNDTLLVNDNTFLKPQQRNIGLVFQDHSLFPHKTIIENVVLGLKEKKESKIENVLEKLEINNLKERYPHEISGGQMQRVALARSIIRNSKLLLLDEPFSNIDQSLKNILRMELKYILKSIGMPAIIVTHDINDALVLADEIALMDSGKIIQKDHPAEIYHNPVNEIAASFFGEVNIIKKENIQKSEPLNKLAELYKSNYRSILIRFDDITYSPSETNFGGSIKDSFFMGKNYLNTIELKSNPEIQLKFYSNIELNREQFVYLEINRESLYYF